MNRMKIIASEAAIPLAGFPVYASNKPADDEYAEFGRNRRLGCTRHESAASHTSAAYTLCLTLGNPQCAPLGNGYAELCS